MFKRIRSEPLAVLVLVLLVGFAVIAAKPAGITQLTSLWIGDATDTADVTPGANDLFVSGTAEVDGDVRLDSDLDVTDSVRAARFIRDTITSPIVAGQPTSAFTLTTADRGKWYSNLNATATATFNLPTESVAGAAYFFIQNGAYGIVVDAPDGQIALGLTDAAGDSLRGSGTAGNVLELIYIGDNKWVQGKIRGTWTDRN